MKKPVFWMKILPIALLALLFLTMLLTVITRASDYGLTVDEAMHDTYGRSVLAWYLTLGRNQSFLHFPTVDYEPEHGAIFDVLVAIAQRIWHSQWPVEAIMIGLTGVLGVLGLALCGLELGGWWFAFLAGLTLWLYPRFFGAIFNNPKDIPFTTATVFVLWSSLLLVRQWEERRAVLRNSLLCAFFLAIALAIRVNAVAWYAILGLLLLTWWIAQRRMAMRKQQWLACLLIGPGSLLGMLLLWPYVLLNPLANFYNSLVVIARYPWNGSVLYQGEMQLAVELPRSYTPVWLVIGSPPMLLLLSLLGCAIFCGRCVKRKTLDLQMTLVLLSFFLPFGLIIGGHSVVYNGLRQFLFLIPSLILLAIYALFHLLGFFWRRKHWTLTVALLLLTCANYLWIIRDMLALYPYEYVYFSPLIGGVQGASTQFELDYWNTCQKAASEWLGTNYQQYVVSSAPTVLDTSTEFQYMTYLPENFLEVAHDPDFLMEVAPFPSATQLPAYRLIHLEAVEGVPLCQVYVRISSTLP